MAVRGRKPGFYVVVSRDFIAENDDVATVVCAPVYGRVLGLSTEVEVGPDDGLPRSSAIRCDFLTLMLKERLTEHVSALSPPRLTELDFALAHALGLDALLVR
jgi:mRNA interferase MazF